ncbi:reverse transcriptase domain-containing protein [Tanacetum coccineum]
MVPQMTQDHGLESNALRFNFNASNIETVYLAIIACLKLLKTMEVTRLQAYIDSLLVRKEVSGEYNAKVDSMILYLEKVQALLPYFKSLCRTQIPRALNKRADLRSKLASLTFNHLNKEVWVEEIAKKSIKEGHEPIESYSRGSQEEAEKMKLDGWKKCPVSYRT